MLASILPASAQQLVGGFQFIPQPSAFATPATGGDIYVNSSNQLIWLSQTGNSIIITGPTSINSQSAAYGLLLTDAGAMIYHPSADTTARTWTIPANASVAYPVLTIISFFNDISAGTVTIAITSDTLVLANAGTTGSVTLLAGHTASMMKITSTEWVINLN